MEIVDEKAMKWLMVGAKPSDMVCFIYLGRLILEKPRDVRKPEKH